MQDAAQDADLGGRGTRPPQQDTARLESPHVTLVTFKSPPGHLRCISKSPLRARAEAGVGTQLKAFVVRQEEVLAAAGSSRELQGSENSSRPFFFRQKHVLAAAGSSRELHQVGLPLYDRPGQDCLNCPDRQDNRGALFATRNSFATFLPSPPYQRLLTSFLASGSRGWLADLAACFVSQEKIAARGFL